ncbi:MAG: CUAEP/CCAEP-tail radical SAM (seleno)protein [Thermoleophilaceae bacterium]
MRLLLVSTYELGHQPLHVASPAAALRTAGHDVRALDTSVEQWDPALVDWADAVAFSVPMHTAMRLALRGAKAVKRQDPAKPVCLYGLYAPVSRDATLGPVADRLIAGEYEPALVAWADGLGDDGGRELYLGRNDFNAPARDLLPPLERYAHLALGGEERPVGYVEATHGCVHKCRHCPLPVIYDGRIRVVGGDVVLADIEQLVEMGARHITFGDPDFLNGVTHSLRIVRAMHERFPDLTFDCTTKVEHILEHAQVWPELAASGCLFVVSALEGVNDEILARLDKGHTTDEASHAIALLREHGIEIRPSFLPFTPWTSLDDVADIVEFVEAHDLVGNVDPVQWSIRLLIPEGSLVLDHDDFDLGPYDAEALSFEWSAPDPRVDALQRELAAMVETGADFGAIRRVVFEAAGRDPDRQPIAAGSVEGRPRLTEPWFC